MTSLRGVRSEGRAGLDLRAGLARAVTYSSLAASVAALYAALVVGPLLVLDRPLDRGPGLALPVVATAAVAVLLEPLRTRTRRLANRLLYGERATPLEVLSRLTAQLSETSERGTDGLARLVVEGSDAEQAVVWVLVGDMLHPHGSWPADSSASTEPVSVAHLTGDRRWTVELIRHGDEVLGAISVAKTPEDITSSADLMLLADVAAGSGLVLRNIGLNAELEERARQVRSSRKRLVAARDNERRRLERDLHDGAQQHVVALKVKLDIAKAIAARDGHHRLVETLAPLSVTTQDAVDALRSIAHGIYPPLLEAEGLGPTLASIVAPDGLRLRVEAGGIGRLERRVEETIYFCVLELVDRVGRAQGTRLEIAVAEVAGRVELRVDADVDVRRLTVTDIADRVDAADGSLLVTATEWGQRIDVVLDSDPVDPVSAMVPA
ncbi:MAG: sensor histidine kinase [Acidimicrobiales bacterium]